MTYEYECGHCKFRFDVVKSVKDLDRSENCPSCGEFGVRQFSFRVHIHGAKVQHPEYNPALGCVVRNKEHRAEICKQKGLIEIGNDYKSADAIVKEHDTAREEKLRKRIEDSV